MARLSFLLISLPLLAAGELPHEHVEEVLVEDAECSLDSAESCALNAVQLRQAKIAAEASAAEATQALELLDLGSVEEDPGSCQKDTGGTCQFASCHSSRMAFCMKQGCRENFLGLEVCEHKCMCPEDFCSVNGVCVRGKYGAPSQRIVREASARFGLSNDQAQLCARQFAKVDKDGDGEVTAADLVRDVQARGKTASEQQMQGFIKTYDLNQDGKLDFFEFAFMFSQTQKHGR